MGDRDDMTHHRSETVKSTAMAMRNPRPSLRTSFSLIPFERTLAEILSCVLIYSSSLIQVLFFFFF